MPPSKKSSPTLRRSHRIAALPKPKSIDTKKVCMPVGGRKALPALKTKAAGKEPALFEAANAIIQPFTLAALDPSLESPVEKEMRKALKALLGGRIRD